MAATPIASTEKFFHPGSTVVYWVPSISSVASPTRSELNAGTDLSNEVREVSGWSIESSSIETPSLGSNFVGNIPGRTTAEDSSITFYADLNGADVRDLLSRGENGFIVWLDGGDTPGNKMDVFPVRVASTPSQRTVDEDPAAVMVQFNITAEPQESVAVPA